MTSALHRIITHLENNKNETPICKNKKNADFPSSQVTFFSFCTLIYRWMRNGFVTFQNWMYFFSRVFHLLHDLRRLSWVLWGLQRCAERPYVNEKEGIYKMGLDLFVICDLGVELSCLWFCMGNIFHRQFNTTSFKVDLQHMTHTFQLAIFRIRLSCSVHTTIFGSQWAPPRFFISRLWCLEKRSRMSCRHSRRSQSSASLRSATPSCSCMPIYLPFSRTNLLAIVNAF